MVPVVKSYGEPRKSDDRRINQKLLAKLKPAQVGYFDGIIPDVEDYDTWLRRQATAVQLRHLNFDEDKLRLFQEGQKLRSFTDARGGHLSLDEVARLDSEALRVSTPVAQKGFDNTPFYNYKVEAYTPDELLTSPRARQQLRDLYTIDANNKIADLSVVDYRYVPRAGVKAETPRDIIRGKRGARFQAQNADPENFYFDTTTGERFNPIIYRPDSTTLDERLKLVRNSKILNNEQKKWIDDFQKSLQDDISTNQRSVVVENLRRTFEQRLNPAAATYAEPWENLTAVVRKNLEADVVNVSRRLRANAQRQTAAVNKTKFLERNGKQGVLILSLIHI